jgi:hypothetical protein
MILQFRKCNISKIFLIYRFKKAWEFTCERESPFHPWIWSWCQCTWPACNAWLFDLNIGHSGNNTSQGPPCWVEPVHFGPDPNPTFHEAALDPVPTKQNIPAIFSTSAWIHFSQENILSQVSYLSTLPTSQKWIRYFFPRNWWKWISLIK